MWCSLEQSQQRQLDLNFWPAFFPSDRELQKEVTNGRDLGKEIPVVHTWPSDRTSSHKVVDHAMLALLFLLGRNGKDNMYLRAPPKNDHAHLYKLLLFPTNWIIITPSSSYGVYLIFLFIIDLKITSVFMKNSFNAEI